MENEVSTNNDFFVGVSGDDIIFLKPVPQKISKDKALRLAAWLAIIADENDDFDNVYNAISNI